MSRYPYNLDTTDEDIIKIEDNVVKAVCNSTTTSYLESLPTMNINIIEATENTGQPMAQLEMRDIRRKQREDPIIDKWRKAIIDQQIPDKCYSKEDFTLKRNFKYLKQKRGILFRETEQNDKTLDQLVIPEFYREDILRGLHNDVGHPGKERTLRLVKERFFWPGMTTDVDNWVTKCDRCLRRKTNTSSRAPLVNVHTTYPLELVCFDFLTLETSKGGFGNILVVTDHFTKFSMAIPTKNQTAKTTADAFYNNFIIHYGIPTRLHSDQGANFESDIIKELCILTNMKKSHTSVYHPQSNSGPERFNRTLLDMLGTLENSQKSDWKKYINSLVFAYNCTPHESTGIAPYELMFGRSPRLPIDTMFENAREHTSNKNTREYIDDLKERMERTRQIVEQHTDKAKQKQKKQYDKKIRGAKIEIGDRVLVKILAHREGKHKLADRFEEDIYKVIDQPRKEIPVFQVRSPNGTVKTLHRNHLHPVNYLDDNEDNKDDTEEIQEKIENIVEHGQEKRTDASEERKSDVTSEESDEDDVGYFLIPETRIYGDARTSDNNSSKARDKENKVFVTTIHNGNDAETIDVSDEGERQDNKGTEEKLIKDSDVTSNKTTDVEEENTEEHIQEAGENTLEETINFGHIEEPADVVGNIIRQDVTIHRRDRLEERHRDIEHIAREKGDEDGSVKHKEEIDGRNLTVEVTDTETDTTLGETDTQTRTKQLKRNTNRKRLLPPDPPRRSDRARKPPKRYEDFQMYGMVNTSTTPYDSRFKALETLIGSGVLQTMDIDTARKLVTSLMS
ncbi:uncharacterized protein LOC132717812 [Ruditapes philippinarum]|uniref:uncharacterized protein LOC132717812 n=1 Tax=Ruditapes philippinarum TaxID=129788 RepID=UPI00295ABFBD|nr:uncharacterized protein LOC132717812 [Ruditapes philippinarum]